MAELSFWLDSYNDIYSDFDPRTLLKRRISEDFTHELELAYRRREENTDSLQLQVPVALRVEADEKLIIERLENYFNREYDQALALMRNSTRRNILMLCSSVIVMIISIIITLDLVASPAVSALRILLEPAGWFFFWNSLEYFFYKRSAELNKVRFWRAVSTWKILFRSY